MKDIEAISREDCLDYFRTYYAPNNATLYVAGDFEPKQALALIKKYYGSIKAGPKAPNVLDAEPDQKGERRAEVRHPAQAPTLMIAWRGPKATDADTLALDVLQYALSVGQSSRLVKSLVYEREACVSCSIDWSWRKDPGAFVAALELKPGANSKDAELALYEELDKIGKDGVTDRELQKAKNNLSAQLLRELATNNGRAHALGHYEALLGGWREGLALSSRYEKVTAQQVKEVAAKYLTPARRSVVTLVPAEPEAQA
jgi:predicted Zn-dependent peptidase